jgi:putative component of toxin-antitoxin plasmid stabilization module
MREKAYRIHRIPEFCSWYEEQTEKSRVQIDERLSKIQDDAYFGDKRSVSETDEV